MNQRSYLDYNATAPIRDEVREAVTEALALPGNPSSVHAEGRAARSAVEGGGGGEGGGARWRQPRGRGLHQRSDRGERARACAASRREMALLRLGGRASFGAQRRTVRVRLRHALSRHG